jgi:hypothetical protein
MKTFNLTLLVFAFISSSAFAQDYLNCSLKIKDNEVDCPFLRSCPQEILENSRSQLIVEVHEGETVTGEIKFKRVLLHPGSKKEKDNKIVLFKEDNRLERLDKKDVPFTSYDLKSGINYSVHKSGSNLDIQLNSSVYQLNINLSGNAKYQDYILTSDNAIIVSCEKMNKDTYEDLQARKEAIDAFKLEKSKSGASKQ